MNKPASFSWNNAKAAQNLGKHGVRFEVATLVFNDPNRVDIQDARADYGEERRIVIGKVQGLILLVVYTMRGDVGRIISARPAHTTEGDAYNGKIHAQQKQQVRFQQGGTVSPKKQKPRSSPKGGKK